MFTVGLSKRCNAFRKDEAGTASIESLFWIPIFVFLLVLILDTSFIFFGKAQALRILQDGNRALSVGMLDDTDATEVFIETALQPYTTNATVTTTVDASGVITTVALIPATDLMSIGSIPVFDSTTISVTSQHFLEQ